MGDLLVREERHEGGGEGLREGRHEALEEPAGAVAGVDGRRGHRVGAAQGATPTTPQPWGRTQIDVSGSLTANPDILRYWIRSSNQGLASQPKKKTTEHAPPGAEFTKSLLRFTTDLRWENF